MEPRVYKFELVDEGSVGSCISNEFMNKHDLYLNYAIHWISQGVKLVTAASGDLPIIEFGDERIDWEMAPITEVYTDGSASKNGKPGAKAAWAVYFARGCLQDKVYFSKVIGKSTNNTGELYAVWYAMRVKKMYQIPGKMIIYSDSEYCCKIWSDWLAKWIKAGDLNKRSNSELIKCIAEHKNANIVLRHVRAHLLDSKKNSGIKQNVYSESPIPLDEQPRVHSLGNLVADRAADYARDADEIKPGVVSMSYADQFLPIKSN